MTVGLLSFAGHAPDGLVATRAGVMNNRDTVNKQAMSRKVHISTEALTSIRIIFPGFCVGLPDFGVGAASTITASIEYPSGTFSQLKFSGSASGTIPDLGILSSDYLAVSIPAFTLFWVRIFVSSTAGVLYNTQLNTFYGEACAFAVSGLSDLTMGGTITDSGLVRVNMASAIVGRTSNPSAIVVGDSICVGAGSDGTGNQNTAGSTAAGYDGRLGIICQSFSTTFPFLNLGTGSESATNWNAHALGRNQLIRLSKYFICQLGVNDFGNLSKTAAQTISALQGIYSLTDPLQKRYQSTITPQSSSTDSWVTTGNQTAVNQTAHAGFNSSLRAGTTGLPLTGSYDLASVVESAQDTDLWAVNGVANFGTSDGLHPNAYSRFVNSGLIGPFT